MQAVINQNQTLAGYYFVFYRAQSDSQLANQKPCLLSSYPAISSYWPDMATISWSLGLI